ncbi:hypothetical protein M3Y99_00838300 [Aphelenchoides fujianensis]|nr:hypothetical protein M3Y99_00838300 [Aphelenchoides fujianensis]
MANKVEEAIRGLLEFFNQCLPDLRSFQVKRMYSSILIFTGFKSEKQLLNDFEAVSGNDLLMSGRRTRALNSIMANFLQNVPVGHALDAARPELPGPQPDAHLPERPHRLRPLRARPLPRSWTPCSSRRNASRTTTSSSNSSRSSFPATRAKSAPIWTTCGGRRWSNPNSEDVRRNEAMAKKAQTDGVKHEHDLLERQTEEKVQNKTALLEKVREAEESIDELKRRLVRSPDRLRKEIRELEITNSERSQSVHSLEMSISHLKQKVEALQRDADHHCEQFGVEFNDVRNDLNALHEASRRHNHLVMRVDQKTAARRAIEHQQQLLEMHQQNTNHATENLDKSNRESCQHKMDIETLKQEVAARNLDASRYLVIIDICHAISELRRHFLEQQTKAEAAVEKFVE